MFVFPRKIGHFGQKREICTRHLISDNIYIDFLQPPHEFRLLHHLGLFKSCLNDTQFLADSTRAYGLVLVRNFESIFVYGRTPKNWVSDMRDR